MAPRDILLSERVILRPWRESDAATLYEYARNPRVGPVAGWPVHTSVENSREIIRDILSAPGTYAITVRPDDIAVGSVGLMVGPASHMPLPMDEGEIGYWIGEPLWGRGYTPEAAKELIRHAFEDKGLSALWIGWFDGNDRSRRVAEKCGFRYIRSEEKYWPLIDKTETGHIARLTREEWMEIK
jgi:RimJ/RimL family protein N-acetyltransferase